MVSEIYDLLVEFENYIVGEQIIKIEHCLLGRRERICPKSKQYIPIRSP